MRERPRFGASSFPPKNSALIARTYPCPLLLLLCVCVAEGEVLKTEEVKQQVAGVRPTDGYKDATLLTRTMDGNPSDIVETPSLDVLNHTEAFLVTTQRPTLVSVPVIASIASSSSSSATSDDEEDAGGNNGADKSSSSSNSNGAVIGSSSNLGVNSMNSNANNIMNSNRNNNNVLNANYTLLKADEDLNCLEGHEWRCRDGLCIPQEKRCDGHFNCYDHSDEYNCDPCPTSEGYFRCGSETSCLEPGKRCDGIIDCWDGSDEHLCIK